MRVTQFDRRRTTGTAEGGHYDPAEHGIDALLPGARATAVLCVLFLLVLVAL